MVKNQQSVIQQCWRSVAVGECDIVLARLHALRGRHAIYVKLVAELEKVRTLLLRWTPSARVITQELPALARELSTALAQSDKIALARVTGRHCPPTALKLMQFVIGKSHACSQKLFLAEQLTTVVVCGVTLIKGLREILGCYARLEVEPTEEQRLSATTDFRERLVRQVELPKELIRKLSVIGRVVLGNYFCPLNDAQLMPKIGHGPGAVAESWIPRSKPWMKNWVACIWDDNISPFVDRRLFRRPFEEEDRCWVSTGRPELIAAESAVQCCVPKDYRGPRIIAKQPILPTYLSHAVSASLRKYLRSSVVREAVCFERQTYNQRCAIIGSRTGEYATLDCKDASDHVRLEHVRAFLRNCSNTLWWYEILRAKSVLLETGEIVKATTTFACMGEYSCFDMETLVILSIIIASLWEEVMGRVDIRRGTVRLFIKRTGVRVYGDDVVIRTPYAIRALEALEAGGLVMNPTKCCITGRFRESCGVDAFFGIDVTALRPRRLPGALRETFDGLRECVQNFLDRGNERAGKWLLNYLQKKFKKLIPVFPLVTRDVGNCIYSDLLYYESTTPARTRYNKLLQRSEVMVPYSRPKGFSHSEYWLDRYKQDLLKGHVDDPPRVWVGQDLPQDEWQGYPSSKEVLATCWCEITSNCNPKLWLDRA